MLKQKSSEYRGYRTAGIRVLGEEIGGQFHLARSSGDLSTIGINTLHQIIPKGTKVRTVTSILHFSIR